VKTGSESCLNICQPSGAYIINNADSVSSVFFFAFLFVYFYQLNSLSASRQQASIKWPGGQAFWHGFGMGFGFG